MLNNVHSYIVNNYQRLGEGVGIQIPIDNRKEFKIMIYSFSEIFYSKENKWIKWNMNELYK